MATQSSNEAVQQQQARQAALTSVMATAMASLWLLIDLRDLAGTLPKYELAVAALVHKYGQTSAALAARFYRQERTAAGVSGKFLPIPADPSNLAQVRSGIGWATKGLWSPPKTTVAVTDASQAVTGPLELPEHVQGAQKLAEVVGSKLVVDAGRNTLIEAIEQDKQARGWAREARPDACSFCALLSTRGAVYKSGQTASFEAHNACHCLPVPVFADYYEPPAYVRQWGQVYADSTRGHSGAAARNAFRVALEAHRNSTEAPQPALV